MTTRPQLPSLICGLAIIAFGVVLLLDRAGSLHLTLGSGAPLLLALLGTVLLTNGLARREDR